MTDQIHPDLSGHLETLNGSVNRAVEEMHEQRLAYERKLTLANEAVAEAKAASTKARRAVRLIGVLALLGALVNAGLWWRQDREADRREQESKQRAADALDAAIVACVNANVTRAAIVEHVDARIGQSWQALGTVLGVDDTDEQRARTAQILAALATELAGTPTPTALGPRDCSPESVRSPAPIAGQ